jgi:HSP20 family protein
MITLFKDPFFNTLDKVFDEAYLRADKHVNSYRQTNVTTSDTDYKVQISVPGLSKDDVKITLKDSVLTISYEKTDKESFTFTNSFKKTYELPDDADEKNITGSVENGVVEVIVPKSKKKSIERLISLN